MRDACYIAHSTTSKKHLTLITDTFPGGQATSPLVGRVNYTYRYLQTHNQELNSHIVFRTMLKVHLALSYINAYTYLYTKRK